MVWKNLDNIANQDILIINYFDNKLTKIDLSRLNDEKILKFDEKKYSNIVNTGINIATSLCFGLYIILYLLIFLIKNEINKY